MTEILFIHSPSLHEVHRMLAEALYSPSGRKALGERCLAEAVEADFEPAYKKELKNFKRFLEVFRRVKEDPDHPIYLLEEGMPRFPVYLKKMENEIIIG